MSSSWNGRLVPYGDKLLISVALASQQTNYDRRMEYAEFLKNGYRYTSIIISFADYVDRGWLVGNTASARMGVIKKLFTDFDPEEPTLIIFTDVETEEELTTLTERYKAAKVCV